MTINERVNPGRARIILVAGMHRSGTSALARVLNLLGYRLGRDLMTPNAGNPLGYWESNAVVRFNDRVLAKLDRHWADPKPLPDRWAQGRAFDKWAEEAAGLLGAEYGEFDGVAIKDPRMSRLLPLWRRALEHLDVMPIVLIACRHPGEVVRSLHTRDGLDADHAARLWLAYTLDAEHGSRSLQRAVVDYARLLEDWRETLAAANATTGSNAFDASHEDEDRIDAFLDPKLRHHSTDLDLSDLEPALKTLVVQVHTMTRDGRILTAEAAADAAIAGHREAWAILSPGPERSTYPERAPDWRLARIRALKDAGRSLEAIERATADLQDLPNTHALHFELGRLLGDADRWEDAARAFARAAEIDPGHAPSHHQLGGALEHLGRLEEAAAALRRATELKVDAAWFHRGLGRVLRKLGDSEGALLAMRAAVELATEHAPSQHLLGNLLEGLGRLEEAATAQRAAIAADGARPWFHKSLARLQGKLGQLAAAIEAQKAAVDLLPDDADVRHLLADLLVKAERWDEAEACYREAIARDQGAPKRHRALIHFLERNLLIAQAAQAAGRATDLVPNDAELHFHHANLLLMTGEPEKSAVALRRAMEIDCSALGLPPSCADLGSTSLSGLDQLEPECILHDAIVRLLTARDAERWASAILREISRAPSGETGFELWPQGAASPIRTPPKLALRPRTEGAPRLSVMVPTYNVKNPEWLLASLESALAQDRDIGQMEIVVVDDASETALAREIAESFDGRVRYESNPQNLGLVGNHNRCVERAVGDFVHILHQDDFVEPGFYDALLRPLDRDEELVAAFSNYMFLDKSGRARAAVERREAGRLTDWLPRLAQQQRLQFSTIIVRKRAYGRVGGYAPELPYAFDWDMWGRLAAAGPIWYDPRPLANFRVHPDSATFGLTSANRLADALRATARMIDRLAPEARDDALRTALHRVLAGGWNEALSSDGDSTERRALLELLTSGKAADEANALFEIARLSVN